MSSSVCTEKKTCFHLVEKVVVIHRGEKPRGQTAMM